MEENNKDGVFRKKTMDRISSADELHDYMRVTTPRLWMLLSVIIALIIGFIVFASLVSMENTVKVQVVVSGLYVDEEEPVDIIIRAKIPDEYFDVVKKGMTVRFNDTEGYLESIFDYGDIGKGIYIELNDPDEHISEGEYDGEIVLEKISPISFLIN